MEGVLLFIAAAVVIFIIRLILRGAGRAIRAAGRSAKGEGSFRDNMRIQRHGMGPFDIRVSKVAKGEGGAPFEFYKVEARGLIPTSHARDIEFVTSVLDVTNDETKPILSAVSEFQEKRTAAYQYRADGGTVTAGQGFLDLHSA